MYATYNFNDLFQMQQQVLIEACNFNSNITFMTLNNNSLYLNISGKFDAILYLYQASPKISYQIQQPTNQSWMCTAFNHWSPKKVYEKNVKNLSPNCEDG